VISRGRAGYDKYRHDFAKLIWQFASPKWNFDDAMVDRSVVSFNNPDHVSIVIHNYRWRLGLAEGEPKYDDLEKRLAEGPVITCPPLPLKVMPTVHHTRTPVPMPGNSRASMCTRSSRAASGTICLRRLRRTLPKLSSKLMVIDRLNAYAKRRLSASAILDVMIDDRPSQDGFRSLAIAERGKQKEHL
jgi:hypothetical protein